MQPPDDPFNLDRFVQAQRDSYRQALAELESGQKRSHWIWFVFPQLAGLGRSSTAVWYSINSIEEARAYLAHPILGSRLRECTETVLGLTTTDAERVFGYIDAVKFRSSMTLFARLTPPDSPFERALVKFFAGIPDEGSLRILATMSEGEAGTEATPR